jgi:hypothetical protein
MSWVVKALTVKNRIGAGLLYFSGIVATLNATLRTMVHYEVSWWVVVVSVVLGLASMYAGFRIVQGRSARRRVGGGLLLVLSLVLAPGLVLALAGSYLITHLIWSDTTWHRVVGVLSVAGPPAALLVLGGVMISAAGIGGLGIGELIVAVLVLLWPTVVIWLLTA